MTLGESADSKTIVPVVVSAVEALFEPAGSLPRAASAFSLTLAVAFSTPAGWSGVWIRIVGSLSLSNDFLELRRLRAPVRSAE
jgi:hypothetical protein